MTSEERALNLMEWLNTDDEEYIATLDKIKDMLDTHAEEARAEQREACLNRSLNNLTDVAFTAAEAVEDGCLSATGADNAK